MRDVINDSEASLQSTLVRKFGSLSVFFGRKMTIDYLIPLIVACFNKRDANLRKEAIASIPQISARVGAQTLADFLAPCLHLLPDLDEQVALQTIKSMKELLFHKTMRKTEALDIFDSFLPFLVHPNTWIREETVNYITYLADPQNQFMSKAEAFCKMRPKVKKYIKP